MKTLLINQSYAITNGLIYIWNNIYISKEEYWYILSGTQGLLRFPPSLEKPSLHLHMNTPIPGRGSTHSSVSGSHFGRHFPPSVNCIIQGTDVI